MSAATHDELGALQAARAQTEALKAASNEYSLTPVNITRDSDGDKRFSFPLGGWREDKFWSSDVEKVRDWSAQFACSFAIRTGRKGGADVTDLDTKGEINAVAWWREAQGFPLGSMQTQTPSGGLHLFVLPCGLPTSAGVFAPNVDTRGDGGLVIAPGGFVEGEAGHYRLLGPWVHVRNLKPFPPDLVAAIKAASPKKRDYRASGEISRHDHQWMVDKGKEWVERLAETARPGLNNKGGLRDYRHVQMGAAMILGRLVEADLCDLDFAWEQLERATLKAWPEGLSNKDRKNIEQGLRDGPRMERWRVHPENGPSAGDGAADGNQTAEPEVHILPAETWAYTDELVHIRQAALSAQVSPDVLLHVCLAILAAGLHHGVRLDTGRRPTVLGYYVAAVGPPGAGKSLALETGKELMSVWLTHDRFEVTGMSEDGKPGLAPIGPASGEGVIEAYLGTVPRPVLGENGQPLLTRDGKVRLKDTRLQVRHNAMISSDEAESLFKVGGRQGNTLIPVLRSMWSGSEVSTTTADATRNRHLPAGSYALCALFGFQPGILDPLFADENGGLPQRFAFAEAAHPDITEEEISWPGDLCPDVPPGAFTMTMPPELRAEVRRHAADRASGRIQASPLDGHRMLLRCRTAALLTLLHGSKEVQDFWELAGTLIDTSCALRDHLAGQQERRTEATARAREDAAVRVAVRSATAVDTAVEDDRIRRAADKVVAKVRAAGLSGLSLGTAKNITTTLRDFAAPAIEVCLASGRLVLKTENRRGKQVEVLHVP